LTETDRQTDKWTDR